MRENLLVADILIKIGTHVFDLVGELPTRDLICKTGSTIKHLVADGFRLLALQRVLNLAGMLLRGCVDLFTDVFDGHVSSFHQVEHASRGPYAAL